MLTLFLNPATMYEHISCCYDYYLCLPTSTNLQSHVVCDRNFAYQSGVCGRAGSRGGPHSVVGCRPCSYRCTHDQSWLLVPALVVPVAWEPMFKQRSHHLFCPTVHRFESFLTISASQKISGAVPRVWSFLLRKNGKTTTEHLFLSCQATQLVNLPTKVAFLWSQQVGFWPQRPIGEPVTCTATLHQGTDECLGLGSVEYLRCQQLLQAIMES